MSKPPHLCPLGASLRRGLRRLALAVALAACAAAPSLADLARMQRAVVRITTYAQRGDWSSPWNRGGVQARTGTGFLLEGAGIMTNAHVVGDAKLLMVHLHEDPTPRPARVVHVAHDSDLALITLEDPAPLAALPALELADTPGLGATVDTLGYPSGTRQVTSTRGVVSRIDAQLYVHSGTHVHLAVQTDAAINPGNSGGPVVHQGKVVGVAFQGNSALENVGFFIPDEVVRRFLRDVEDGRYHGYPTFGAVSSSLENPAFRRYLGMAPDETGVRVYRLTPGSSADGHVQVGDVVLEVEGAKVANDGSVASPVGRIPYGLLVDRLQVGEDLRMTVLRDGQRLQLAVPLDGNPTPLERGRVYDHRPRYLLYAGLVFAPLEREVLATYGGDWTSKAPTQMLDAFVLRPSRDPETAQEEPVVLRRLLEHPVNARISWVPGDVVETVDGQRIRNLREMAAALDAAAGRFVVIEFMHSENFLVLDRAQALAAHPEILEAYGIEEDRFLGEEAP